MPGRKVKVKRNISGLRNQPKPPQSAPTLPPTQPDTLSIGDVNSELESDAEWTPNLALDSMKTHLHAELEDEPLDTDLEEWGEWEVGTEGFYVNLMQFAVDNNDDPRDENWTLEALK